MGSLPSNDDEPRQSIAAARPYPLELGAAAGFLAAAFGAPALLAALLAALVTVAAATLLAAALLAAAVTRALLFVRLRCRWSLLFHGVSPLERGLP